MRDAMMSGRTEIKQAEPGAAANRGRHGIGALIDTGIVSLRQKLADVDVAGASISDYSARYLGESLAPGAATLQICGRILSIALRDEAASLETAAVIDYGGGNGLLSLLAREIGVGTVIYNDIYDVSCVDAERLGSALGLEAELYIHGDLGDLIAQMRQMATPRLRVCSYDVIEHVYDIEAFLIALPHLSDGPLRVVMGSAANSLNPLRNLKLMRFQREVEKLDRVEVWGHNQRDTIRAYLAVRSAIIREYSPSLQSEQVRQLALATRGRARSDIEADVDAYLATGVLPRALDHPTNTCDPNTGNWAEHLMDPWELARILSGAGLRSSVAAGLYGSHHGSKGVAARMVNFAILLGGRHGLRLAPYYILIGERP